MSTLKIDARGGVYIDGNKIDQVVSVASFAIVAGRERPRVEIIMDPASIEIEAIDVQTRGRVQRIEDKIEKK